MRTMVVSALAVWALHAAPCLADQKDPATADALFRAGREAAVRNDTETAYERFRESYRLDPAAGTLLNVADSEASLGRLADAWEHYLRVLDTLDAMDDRVALVRDRLSGLAPRVPKLELSPAASASPTTEVTLDGMRLTPASFGIALPQNPGSHELWVSAPGHAPARYTVVLTEGETRRVVVEPGPAIATSTRRADRGPSKPVPAPDASQRRAAAYWLFGAASASAIATSVFAWRYAAESSTAESRCPAVHECDDEGLRAASVASFVRVAAIVSGATTLACVGGGLALLWTAPRSSAPKKSAHTGGVTWTVDF